MKMHNPTRLTTLALLACLAGIPTAYAATTTTTFTVTATVPSVCSVSATNLSFGTYANAQIDATSIVSVTCTSGGGYTVALDNGTNYSVPNRRMTNGSASLNYELYSDSGRSVIWNSTNTVAGTGSGSAQDLTVYGRLTATQGLIAGFYTDTITVTVTY
jgi:spore coat protein U-like protein